MGEGRAEKQEKGRKKLFIYNYSVTVQDACCQEVFLR